MGPRRSRRQAQRVQAGDRLRPRGVRERDNPDIGRPRQRPEPAAHIRREPRRHTVRRAQPLQLPRGAKAGDLSSSTCRRPYATSPGRSRSPPNPPTFRARCSRGGGGRISALSTRPTATTPSRWTRCREAGQGLAVHLDAVRQAHRFQFHILLPDKSATSVVEALDTLQELCGPRFSQPSA